MSTASACTNCRPSCAASCRSTRRPRSILSTAARRASCATFSAHGRAGRGRVHGKASRPAVIPARLPAVHCPPAHPLATRKKVKAAELNGQDFVLFERDIPTRRATDRILKSHNVTVRRVAEFDNIETIKRAVEVGFGAAIVPRPSVLDEQRSGKLSVVALAEPEWTRAVGIIHRTDRPLSMAALKFTSCDEIGHFSGFELKARPEARNSKLMLMSYTILDRRALRRARESPVEVAKLTSTH